MGYAGEGEREREGVQGVDEVIGNGKGRDGRGICCLTRHVAHSVITTVIFFLQ